MSHTTPSNALVLNLPQIASWFHGRVRPQVRSGPIVASVPKMQRGLVWEPSQIELLWDSLLRGFPIGSLVVCPRIPGQDDGDDPSVTHHLLDGQQRSHAIALGYEDPFADSNQCAPSSVESILWMDLMPNMPGKSTRDFLLRLTTCAHPWGFQSADNCDPLRTRQIRESLAAIGLDPSSPDYKRPLPVQLRPVEATVPIPMAWLTCGDPMNPEAFWVNLRNRCAGSGAEWGRTACQFLDDASDEAEASRKSLILALQRLNQAAVVALPAPDSILGATRAESAAPDSAHDHSAIEHLFQRLNQMGTRLDGEELAYSMIKAYWPQVSIPIRNIMVRRMPASRLVMMSARAALTEAGAKRLRGTLSVSDIRKLAMKRDGDTDRVLEFIKNRLKPCCDWIEESLLFDAEKNPEGFLPVHLANIARNHPEVYVLLLHLADRQLQAGAVVGPANLLRPALLAMVMRLSWFSTDAHQAVNQILSACSEGVTVAALQEAVRSAEQQGWLQVVPTPEQLGRFLDFKDQNVESWTWHTPIHGDGVETRVELRRQRWGPLLDSLGNRDLLLYAQRAFIARRFADYDPSRRDLWKGHNRPWDFDHILAKSYVNKLKADNQYQRFVKQWLDGIGNLRAWPFEDNRSESAQLASDKLSNPDALACSFLLPEELPAFSLARQTISDEAAARAFGEACLNRLIRIYSECWTPMARNS